MQQHISVDMLNELSPEAKERLRQWWKPKDGDWMLVRAGKDFYAGKQGDFAPEPHVLYDDGEYVQYHAESKTVWGYGILSGDMYPLLSIGQLIELLGDNLVAIDAPEPPFEARWYVATEKASQKKHPDLIRALWDAAKAVLEE